MPRSGSAPRCRYRWDDVECDARGGHFCGPRADHAQAWFEEVLVHTKGKWARTPFVLAGWQRDEIVRPLFGETTWDVEHEQYRRQYRISWIELARKQGKSEMLAGIALFLLFSDGEEGAEIYGCAADRDQARKVYDVAERMVQLSPFLSKKLTVKSYAKRIIYEKTGSYYEVIASDAAGNLGHNPHGIIFDEILTQPNRELWDALRTAMGTRVQPLMVAATTPGNDPASFAAVEHEEMVRIAEDPGRAPHVHTFIRNTPKDADPWDEANWVHANPALGDFLSVEALRQEALEAKNDPTRENSFRQFRLSQWVQQAERWLSLQYWDAQPNIQLMVEDDLVGEQCFGGLDLASKLDLTALCWHFGPDDDSGVHRALWRFWLPEDRLADMDRRTGGKASVWAREGWIHLTEGDVTDYRAVLDRIDGDCGRFDVAELGFDPWNAQHLINELNERGVLETVEVRQGYASLSAGMQEWQRLIVQGRYVHGGNPVMRWMADNLVARSDVNGNVAPDRKRSHEKIDGCVAAIMALGRWQAHVDATPRVHAWPAALA